MENKKYYILNMLSPIYFMVMLIIPQNLISDSYLVILYYMLGLSLTLFLKFKLMEIVNNFLCFCLCLDIEIVPIKIIMGLIFMGMTIYYALQKKKKKASKYLLGLIIYVISFLIIMTISLLLLWS